MPKTPPTRKLQHLRSLIIDLGLSEDRVSRRLATELHDHLVQSLVLCRMKMGLLGVHMKQEPALSLFSEAKRYLDDSIACAREVLSDLHPVYLGGPDGLRSAMAWLGEKLRRHGLKVTIEDDGQSIMLDEQRIIILYRSIHKLLFSIPREADSGEVTIRMRRDRQSLEVIVEGFSRKGVRNPAGKISDARLALSLIEEYLTHFGGRLEVSSRSGKPATVRLLVPLSHMPDK